MEDTKPSGPATLRSDAVSGSAPAMPTLRSDVVSGAAPVMPTLVGAPVPDVLPPSMPPARYEVGKEIARGGMGRVVEATDTLLGRVVALKEALSTEADSLLRFARETKITARLEHPSIVPVHDAGKSSNGAPFYVMRKVSGRPLEELVATSHTLALRLALIPHIVASAQAIAHAHGRGIVHRDIKPSNILVGDLGETIVIDWGLAKVIGEPDEVAGSSSELDPEDSLKTRVGVVYGTPGFMAPEQLQGAPVDERCDVYALGATLYYLLSRKPPHHAKTADLMMRAAVDGPPTPLASIVAGVPPELLTIIDKSLAQDPAQRYQNAKALVEDLQRFLTGQLVASHRYSARERLVRFVRRNRVPVIAVTAATLALIVGGTIAVTRVVNERDRADESARIARDEKRAAEDRADQLTLTQARYNVETNPTLALAMIKPLATKYWREVRDIGAAARSAGVAWSLPGSTTTLSLELSRDGLHAISAGEDGVVRYHDLVKHTTSVVADLHAPVRAQFADHDRRVVVFHAAKLAILDVETGKGRELDVAGPIDDLEVVETTAYWVDHAHALWQLELAGTPRQIPVDEAVHDLSPSPDGRWIALYGEYHLRLLDRTKPTEPPLEVMAGETKDVGWAADSSHLAALVEQSLIDLEMATLPTPTIVHKLSVGKRFAVAYGGGQLYTVGPTGVSVVTRTESIARRQFAGTSIGIREARGGTMVIGAQGNLVVLSDDGDRQLAAPVDQLIMLEASPRSPYVVAAVEGRLLEWNLDDIQPRQVGAAPPAAAGFVGGDQLIASFVDAPSQWIELATGHATAIGMMPAARSIVAPPGRASFAAVIDLTHHARIVGPGRPPEEITGEVDIGGFVNDHQVVLANRTGLVELYDTTLHQKMTLLAPRAALLGIGWSPNGTGQWITAALDDGTLWRHDVSTGAETTLQLTAKPTGTPIVTADGTVFYAEGASVRVWRVDATRDLQATLPKPIAELALVGANLIAFTNDGSAYALQLAAPNTIPAPISINSSSASMSAETGLVVTQSRGGSLDVIDPLAKQKWTLAASTGLVYTAPQISIDGRRVLALTQRSLLVWTLALPSSAAELPAWLDAQTNATVERGIGELTWR